MRIVQYTSTLCSKRFQRKILPITMRSRRHDTVPYCAHDITWKTVVYVVSTSNSRVSPTVAWCSRQSCTRCARPYFWLFSLAVQWERMVSKELYRLSSPFLLIICSKFLWCNTHYSDHLEFEPKDIPWGFNLAKIRSKRWATIASAQRKYKNNFGLWLPYH